MERNNGLILVNPPVTQWVFGGVSGITGREVRMPSRNWDEFLTIFESQVFPTFDSFACVTYSALNNLEILWKQKYGFEKNWSDRFTAKMSGTTSVGNTFYNVADSIRNDGLVEQALYENETPTRSIFYQPVPESVKEVGERFVEENTVSYEFVPYYPDAIWDALQYGPLQVAGYAWSGRDSQGYYVKTDRKANHGFTVYGGEYGKTFKVFDHYHVSSGDSGKKVLNWNYRFWAAILYDIEKRIDIPMKFNEGTLYQLTTPPGGFYLMAAGKLRRDDLAKLEASFLVRNGGNILGKVDTLVGDDLEGVKVYDLKGNEVPKW